MTLLQFRAVTQSRGRHLGPLIKAARKVPTLIPVITYQIVTFVYGWPLTKDTYLQKPRPADRDSLFANKQAHQEKKQSSTLKWVSLETIPKPN